MGTVIKDIEYYLPETILSNNDLMKENPSWDMEKVALKTGVQKRHIARDSETACDLAIQACARLFSKYDKDIVDAIIFCTQSPDYIMPSNAYLIHRHFGFKEKVIAFDITQACSGYVYGLVIANSLIVSGTAENILLVNADTYSKYINKKDRSTRSLFGDGASATFITSASSDTGIIDFDISSSGKGFENFYIPAGGCKLPYSKASLAEKTDDNGNVYTDLDIHMDGMGVLNFFRNKVTQQVRALLSKNKLSIDDIDLFVFHQASKVALDSLSAALKIPPDKMYVRLTNVGNLVSASIPVALKMAMDEGKLRTESKVLISGFGVGLSWASMLIRL